MSTLKKEKKKTELIQSGRGNKRIEDKSKKIIQVAK